MWGRAYTMHSTSYDSFELIDLFGGNGILWEMFEYKALSLPLSKM